MEKIIKIAISDLQPGIFTRSILDESRITFLASLIDAGVELDPILITIDNKVIAGKHRVEAYKKCGVEVIDAIVKHGNMMEITRMAIASNLNGPLPTTEQDLRLTFQGLIEAGATEGSIISNFRDILPVSFVRKLYDTARWEVGKQRIAKALRFLSENPKSSIESVAKEFKLTSKQLQSALVSKVNKHNGNGAAVAIMNKELNQRFAHFNKCTGKLVQSLFQRYNDGDIDSKQGDDIMGKIASLNSNQVRMVADWQRRWNNRKS